MVRRTSSAESPWHVVPADHKWFARLVIVSAIVDTLASLDLAFPPLDADRAKELETARVSLASEREPVGRQASRRRRGRP
jgi:hypothetical protein